MEKHFTATVYIISKIDGQLKVLLHKHKKLKIWLPVGGHIEKNEDPIEAALREVKEEARLEVKLIAHNRKLLKTRFAKEILAPPVILEEKIPAFKNTPAHFHIDLTYFGIAKNPGTIKMKEEYKWISKKDLGKMNLEKEVVYLAKKALSV